MYNTAPLNVLLTFGDLLFWDYENFVVNVKKIMPFSFVTCVLLIFVNKCGRFTDIVIYLRFVVLFS